MGRGTGRHWDGEETQGGGRGSNVKSETGKYCKVKCYILINVVGKRGRTGVGTVFP